ncbi:MAG: tetratricopeptide repeat protein [Chlorobiota bacterium]
MQNTKFSYILVSTLLIFFSYTLFSINIDSLRKVEFKDEESIEFIEYNLKLSKLFRDTDYNQSIEYAEKGLEVAESLGNDTLIYKSYKKLAFAYKHKGNLDDALEYFLSALELAKDLKRDDYLAITYNNIGVLYIRYDQWNRALDYLNESRVIAERNNDTVSIANLLNNIGIIHWNNEDYDSSFNNIRESMLISLAIGDSSGLISSYNNLGMLQIRMGDTTRALGYYNQAAKLAQEQGELWEYANVLNNRARILLDQHKVEDILDDLNQAISISKQINSKLLESDSYQLQSIYYQKLDKYDSAFYAHKQYSKLRMEVINSETSNKIAGIEKDFELKARDKHLKELSDANEIQYYLILLLGTSLVFLGVFIFIAYRNSKKNKVLASELTHRNQELEKMSEDKSKYFTLISHDLKAPLYNISNLSGLVKNYKNDMSEEEYESTLDLLSGSSKQVIDLIDNILIWTKTQTGNIEIQKSQFYVDDMIKNCLKILGPAADEKQVELIYKDNGITMNADKSLISTATRNLISNAIKFSHPESAVIINCLEKIEEWHIEVSDTGVGMSQEQIDNILNGKSVTTNGTRNERGSGLGLLITKEFIELTEGELEISSEIGKGSNFLIKIKK